MHSDYSLRTSWRLRSNDQALVHLSTHTLIIPRNTRKRTSPIRHHGTQPSTYHPIEKNNNNKAVPTSPAPWEKIARTEAPTPATPHRAQLQNKGDGMMEGDAVTSAGEEMWASACIEMDTLDGMKGRKRLPGGHYQSWFGDIRPADANTARAVCERRTIMAFCRIANYARFRREAKIKMHVGNVSHYTKYIILIPKRQQST